MEAATPKGTAQTEDPGLSVANVLYLQRVTAGAKEAAEVVPAESVRRNGNQH